MAYGSSSKIFHLKFNGRILCKNERADFACRSVADFQNEPIRCKRCDAKVAQLPVPKPSTLMAPWVAAFASLEPVA